MSALASGLTTTALVLAVIIPIDVWVFIDARRRSRSGQPVVLTLGGLRIADPRQWLVGSLVLFVLFVPAYLAARGQQ